jgi:predicted dehydrogenase
MAAPQTIRWAILGAGKIAHKFAKDFKAVQRAQLVAVAASNPDRARTFADQYGISTAYGYDNLYQSTDVDAVYIATTHNFHYEQCLACLRSGKAALCEKPITINDAQFKELAVLAKEKGVFLMEALWTYFLPALQKAAEWLAQGKIGTLQRIQADFSFKMPFDPKGRLYNPELAGGALLDLGIYPIAFANYFTNRPPDSVLASGVLGSTGVDESTALILKYDTVYATLFTSLLVQTLNKGFLFGDAGYIEVPDFWKASSAKLYTSDHQLAETFEDQRTTWGYNYETQHVTDCLLQGDTESRIVPHAASNRLQELMTEVRRQMGFVYPMER